MIDDLDSYCTKHSTAAVVTQKLRGKGATIEECIEVAKKFNMFVKSLDPKKYGSLRVWGDTDTTGHISWLRREQGVTVKQKGNRYRIIEHKNIQREKNKKKIRLTKKILDILITGLEGIPIQCPDKTTLKALVEGGLVDDHAFLTEEGIIITLEKQPLNIQCSFHKIPIEIITINYDTNCPERSALGYFEEKGYVGTNCEGGAILTVLKALCLDKLAKVNIFNSRQDACLSYLEAQLFSINKDTLTEILAEIKNISDVKFIDNFREIISHQFINEIYPSLSVNFAQKFIKAADRDRLYKVAKIFSERPYLFRKGWPDLTIVKDCDIRFVEVKTTDRLHKSQLITIPLMRKYMLYDFYVLKLAKNKI